MKQGISVIIPAYNESRKIAATVKAAWTIPGVKEVIVVDDGSIDGTGEKARAAGANVIDLVCNRGKGRALARGIAEARQDIILLLDADLGGSAAQGRLLVQPLLSGMVDMTVASFPSPRVKAGFGLAMALARYGTWFLTGVKMQAPLSGQRGFTKKALHFLQPLLPGFGVEVGFNVRAARRGLRIQEIPVKMSHEVTGWNLQGIRHRAIQFWHVLQALVRLFWER
ncbi:MAG TPA: glycosyltransferase family 2 protein [Firmicutes bacterium]|nr:glycosyltransferase family 2 protein [Bacillota bacterium]